MVEYSRNLRLRTLKQSLITTNLYCNQLRRLKTAFDSYIHPVTRNRVIHRHNMAQSAGVVEYTDSFSAEEYECPKYDNKQSDGEVQVMLELWGMRSTPSLPSFPSPPWPGVVAPDMGPMYAWNKTKPWFLDFIVLFPFKLRIYGKLNCLK